ncbi:replication initiation and membrane attachment family protein [Bacillus horti]|uniref:Replication initiation and membrane attachment protein n=1 Tax=Caldalkalibacillus horti TaxID=77523 RepID=A0ABT9VWB7_9BACI|nr:DnaD domain protein [Bacillus horti]MDQ0165286.1 replication initiation and membrane attachment protein [Bacillus horti]
MALVWNEVKPIDGFRVQAKRILSHTEHKTLTHLYQPIIGALSYALYLTLLDEVEGERLFSVEKNHQWLMKVMNQSLDVIYQSRLRLEALGLLKTYVLHKDEDQTLFEYELYHPLTPEQYFGDDLLSICLYNQVGAQRYKELRVRYSANTIQGGENLQKQKHEITKEFHQVFSSLSPSELVAKRGSELNDQLSELEQSYPLPKQADSYSGSPTFERFALDIDVLKSLLMKGLKADEIYNGQSLPYIKKIAFFYQLDEWSISRIVQDSLSNQEQLDLGVLSEKAKEWYRFQEGGQPPRIIHDVQPIEKRVFTKPEELTEEERHLYQLENLSPLQLLEQFQRGGKVAEADVRLAEELLLEYKLEPAVINLLLEYIFYTNNYKLPRSLVTKVAAHWKRFNVQTVKEAQELALKEQQQYKEWQSKQEQKDGGSKSTGRANSRNKQPIRTDKLPPWIEAQQKNEREMQRADSKIEKEESMGLTEAEQERRRRIEEKLKSLESMRSK